ncbi:hypothetical protein NAD41_002353 [Salmonella enterica]|nr:hypothetical protein [Salmonella enterica]EKK6596321.1 hypothetical protein [Salmonella enterica]
MFFKWRYAGKPDPEGAPHVLMLGKNEIGEVYPLPDGQWRAKCNLPGSGRYGTYYVHDFPFEGVAKSTVELIASMWVNDSGLLTQ